MSDPVAIAQALIRCPSVTPNEGGALAYLALRLAAAGFGLHRPVFHEAGTPSVENLYARIGEGSPCLVFAGHTDVVPPGDETLWTYPPFGAEISNGRLYGRGAADMKGAVAAFVAATLQHIAANGAPKKGSIGFLITGDEEGPAINGTAKLLQWAQARGERFDHCLLGEPTNPDHLGEVMKAGRRGSLTGEIILYGQQGHVAYPHLAKNPIPDLARFILALYGRPFDAGSEHFSPSHLEFTTIDIGNPASNVIPAKARATFNIRFNDHWTQQTLAEEITIRLAEVASSQTRYDLIFQPSNATAFLTKPGPFTDLVAKAIMRETGRSPGLSTSGGTSDARFIKDYCDVIEFGLVGQTMHQVDENVAVADIEALTRIYRHVIEAYLATA